MEGEANVFNPLNFRIAIFMLISGKSNIHLVGTQHTLIWVGHTLHSVLSKFTNLKSKATRKKDWFKTFNSTTYLNLNKHFVHSMCANKKKTLWKQQYIEWETLAEKSRFNLLTLWNPARVPSICFLFLKILFQFLWRNGIMFSTSNRSANID